MTDDGYDIERYLNVRSAYGAGFGPDGTLAFLMDTTGTTQLWTLSEPEGWPEQRTFYEEPVSFFDWSPERSELVFGMDEGGNERLQFYRLDEDGHVTDLTRHPDAKHFWGGWDSDGERFAFASNRRDEAVFDVYVQGRDETGEDAERIYDGEGWVSIAGWSPDDSRLAVHRAHSNFDHDVYVLDLDSGELTHLTPDEYEDREEGVRYGSVSWGPDGDALYCVSDRGADTLYLARLGLDGSLETVVEGGDYNVDGVALDDETGRIAYSRNVDGYTELTVGDLVGETAIEERPTPDLPGDLAGGVAYDDAADAERFALTVSGETHNANVHVVDAATGESERWTRASTAGIPPESFRGSELVHYGTFDGREIPALFALPAEVPEGGAPVVVEFHGGPEAQHRPSFSAVDQYLLSHGYGVFRPNVRGSTGYGRAFTHLDDGRKRMDSVRDGRAAAEWLREHPDVDGDRLVAMGGSYGGFMVLACLTEYPDLWAAGVDIVGIANFVTFLENTGAYRRELREREYGSLEADREFLESISPVHEAHRIRAPLFVVHGANDPRVPLGEADQIVAEAGEHVPVEELVFEDEGHGISKRENRIEAYTQIVAFLDEHV